MWQVNFQLYFEAKDSDPEALNADDDLDDIIINRVLEVNTGYTAVEQYTGIHNRVTVPVRFKVMCQLNYYGADCNTHCVTQNDYVNGHYTCDSDGSIQCLEGFENPQNDCRDSKLMAVSH